MRLQRFNLLSKRGQLLALSVAIALAGVSAAVAEHQKVSSPPQQHCRLITPTVRPFMTSTLACPRR